MAPYYFNFSENRFSSALMLQTLFPAKWRGLLAVVLNTAIVLSLIPFGYALIAIKISSLILLPVLLLPLRGWLGIAFILLAPRMLLFAIECFSNSKTSEKNGEAPDQNLAVRFNFFAAELWHEGMILRGAKTTGDLLAMVPHTPIGALFLSRLGVREEYETLLDASRNSVSPPKPLKELFDTLAATIDPHKDIAFTDLMTVLTTLSPSFREALASRKINDDALRNTALWVEEELAATDARRRRWTRRNLSRIPGLAKGWAYGKTPLLEKYAAELTDEARSREEELIGREREIELLEAGLLKTSGANVILVGEAGAGKRALLLGLTRMIAEGRIFPDLEHKRVWQLYGETVVAAGKTKGAVEEIFMLVLNEAVKAGNIILAIDNFPEFVESLAALGVNAEELLSPYLSSRAIHIVALAETISFRRTVEGNEGLLRFFEKVEIAEPSHPHLVQILQDEVPRIEAASRHKIIFTYHAIQAIAYGAVQYLVGGAAPKRAMDLMEGAAGEALQKGLPLITESFIEELIERKTKIPLGDIGTEEREKLLNLEEFLHQRVVDQEEAILAVADSIRRARSEIRNPQRPIGTFLFLGPTGVGKTETAKALAEVYFGNEEAMARFDMTEYQTDEGLSQLVGSVEKDDPGVLTSRMRAHPYGLVLLDEFEKSSKEVKDLFLQVLDEGFFSDYRGEQINMRNTIIIATSNAGSNLIWEMVREGIDPSKIQEQIIAHIQKEKILSPELLNRFDALIIFRPLNLEVLRKIARIMLEKLSKRLTKENIFFQITDELADAVAEGGYNPEFGARPMQRFIQNRVEKIIADRIIRGEIKPGSKFSLGRNDVIHLGT